MHGKIKLRCRKCKSDKSLKLFLGSIVEDACAGGDLLTGFSGDSVASEP
jgi:hypothetical protein